MVVMFMLMNLAVIIAKFTGHSAFDYALSFGVQKSRSGAAAFWLFHLLWLSLLKFSLFFLMGGTISISLSGGMIEAGKHWYIVDPLICASYCGLMFYAKELHLSQHAVKYYIIFFLAVVTGYFSLAVGLGFVAYLSSRHRLHDIEQEGLQLMTIAHGMTKFKRRKEKIKYDDYDIPLNDYDEDYEREFKKLKKEHNKDPGIYMRYSPMVDPNELGEKGILEAVSIKESARRDTVKEVPSVIKGHHIINKSTKVALAKASEEQTEEQKKKKKTVQKALDDVTEKDMKNAKFRIRGEAPAVIKGFDLVEPKSQKKLAAMKKFLLPKPKAEKIDPPEETKD